MILNCIPSLHSDFLVGLSQTFPVLTFLGPSAEFDLRAPLCCWNPLSSWLLWFPIFLVVFVLVWQLLSRLPCRCLFFRLPLLVGILQGSILGPLFSPLLFSFCHFSLHAYINQKNRNKTWIVWQAAALSNAHPQLWYFHFSLMPHFPKGQLQLSWVLSTLGPALHLTAKRLC